ncbi:Small-conductance mechanosensitive channel [Sedimentisphaera salicampi]|nr:Small-conductance mechanosensitive channel [Sedimentisphaera salicampi]
MLERRLMSKLFVLLVVFAAACGLYGDNHNTHKEERELKIETVGDFKTTKPDISIANLKSLLKPLRKAQIEKEAEGWMNVLQNNIKQISTSEIADAPPEELSKLHEHRTNIIDRLSTVLQELKQKGGEAEEYEKYISAVSKANVDVSDVNGTSKMLMSWLKSPNGGIRWGIRIGSFIAVLIAFYILAAFLGGIVRRAAQMNKKASELLRNFFVNMVKKIVVVIGLVVALSTLGLNVAPLIAGIGAVGFIVGFALQGTLNNFAAGIMILLHRPYDIGDVVNTAGVSGVVESMSLNTTTIKSFDNQIVVVPNGSIWGDVITNVTGSDIRRVDMVFGISYDSDISKAQEILLSLVKSHSLVLDTPEPNIQVHELADSSVNLICRPWVKTGDYWTVYWNLMRTVKEEFDKAGISIPFPQTDVHLYSELKKNKNESSRPNAQMQGKRENSTDMDEEQ